MSSQAMFMADPRLRAASLTAVIASTFFLGLAHGIAYPLTALTFERWGAPALVTGIAAGMPALAALLLLPVAPRIASRLGFVPAMAGGSVLGVLGFVLMPSWQSIEGWLVIRFLMGVVLLFPWLLAETWINAVSEERARGRVLALYTVALFGGYGAGPIVLGYMPVYGTVPFAFAGGVLLLSGGILLLASKLSPRMSIHPTGGFGAMYRLVPIGMVAALFGGALEYTYIALLPTFGLRQGIGENTALYLVSAFLWGGVALSLLFGWLADRINREHLVLWLVFAFVALAIPSALLATADPRLALASTFVLGGVACAFYTLGLTIMGEKVSARDLTSANALFLILYQVGTLAGPPLVGATMDASEDHGFLAAILVLAALAAATIVATLLRRRGRA